MFLSKPFNSTTKTSFRPLTTSRVVYKGPKRLHTTTPLGTETFATTTTKPTTIIQSASTQQITVTVTPSTKPLEHLKVAPLVPKMKRQKTKKIVIVKRKKPDSKFADEDDDDRVVEKRTIKRRVKVTLKGNNGTMPANYTTQILHEEMNDFKI